MRPVAELQRAQETMARATPVAAGRRVRRILVFSTVYPSAVQPHHGVFVRERMRGLPPECEVRVVAPVPWFPLLSSLRPGLRPRLPRREEDRDGAGRPVPVVHPRFPSVPGVLKCLDGLLLALATWRELRRLRREFPFEIIDAHFVYPEGLAAVLLGRLLRVPVSVTLRGTLPLLARYRLRRPQLLWTLRRADHVLAVAESLRRSAVALGIPERRVRMIPNGVDPDRFRPLDREECRRRLGLLEEPGFGAGPFLLSVGTLSPRKGFDLLLAAVASLQGTWPGIRLLLVGGAGAEGYLRPELERWVGELGIARRVLFAGPRDGWELPLWYGAADLFVLASHHEGCPNVVLEALACGTPVVATAVGDVPRILASGQAGVVVERPDAACLETGIAQALERDWDRRALARRAAERPWSRVGREVLEIFEGAAPARLPEVPSPPAAPLRLELVETGPQPCLEAGEAAREAGVRRIVNAFSVDVEEYFQVSAFEGVVAREDWHRFEPRVEDSTLRLLELCARHGVRGTFFTLGWVARRYPELIRRIVAAGHELASHGWDHKRVTSMTPEALRADVRRAKAVLEDVAGTEVLGYRAPSYSIVHQTLWALDILMEEGHRYDSSIFPILHDRYGIPGAPRFPHSVYHGDGSCLEEFPISTLRLAGLNLPFVGGGYTRVVPFRLARWGIRRLNRVERQPVMVYTHPWEIDPNQPRVEAGPLTRLRHYRNLERTEGRLTALFGEFPFTTVREVLGL